MACEECKRVPPPLVEVKPGHFVACHKLEKKMENGEYLFHIANKAKKSTRGDAAEGAEVPVTGDVVDISDVEQTGLDEPIVGAPDGDDNV